MSNLVVKSNVTLFQIPLIDLKKAVKLMIESEQVDHLLSEQQEIKRLLNLFFQTTRRHQPGVPLLNLVVRKLSEGVGVSVSMDGEQYTHTHSTHTRKINMCSS
jgi:hypothetical protein